MQVISLTVRSNGSNTEELNYCKMLNSLLPKDIRIIAWSQVKDGFSARFDCGSRTYKYWFPRGDLDVDVCTFFYYFYFILDVENI